MPCGELTIELLVSNEYDGFVKRDVSIVDQIHTRSCKQFLVYSV